MAQATATPAGAPPLNLVQATAGGASLANPALVIDFDTSLFGTAGAPAPAPDAAAAAPAPPAGTAVSTASGVRLAGVLNGAVRNRGCPFYFHWCLSRRAWQTLAVRGTVVFAANGTRTKSVLNGAMRTHGSCTSPNTVSDALEGSLSGCCKHTAACAQR